MEKYQENDTIRSLPIQGLQADSDRDPRHAGAMERNQTLCILPEWLRLLRSQEACMAVGETR